MTKREVITGENIPHSHLPFSPGLSAGDFVFVSGQASVDESGKIINDSFEGECRRSFENVKKVLAGAGLDLSDVVQVRSFVGKQEDLIQFNQIYTQYFYSPFPARTTLIGCLGDLLRFEVEVIALKRKVNG